MGRVVKQGGPAVLFENVQGSSFPLVINIFGTDERIAWALGREPEAVGDQIKAMADDLMPPRVSALWKHRALIGRARHMKPCFTSRAPVLEVEEAADFDKLPVLTCWPEDGGRFITYPLVMTQSPVNGRRNLGIYRIHVYDKTTTGMHWQIQKGGGFHYDEAERRNEALPVAVVLGADPASMLAGVLPLPEGIDELAFAGFLRGRATRFSRVKDFPLPIPADAEIVVEGWVPPKERRMEGPFGDHFGHYSHAAPFPVFHARKIYHRRNAIFPAAIVGKPPQEDKHMGNAVQQMLLPLLKVMRPELTDLWTYFEAGFHNLAVASVRQRYKKEAVKTAFALLGEGQMSLTKCVILVDPDVNVRRFADVLDALRRHFDPQEDFLMLPGTAQDTLDFTSFKMNLGSKMVLDATASSETPAPNTTPSQVPPLGPGVLAQKNWRDCLLVVQVEGEGRAVVERLVKDPALAGFRLIAAVSRDVPMDDEELLVWGLFTRFDCARDLTCARAEMKGAWPRYQGPLGLDATWKTGYPKPVGMDPAVVKKVDQRWKEYGIN